MSKCVNLNSFVFILSMLMCCSPTPKSAHQTNQVSISQNTPITIDIQPFIGITPNEVNYVANEVKKLYGNITIKKPIRLPDFCKNQTKTRYRADSLINYLNRQTLAHHLTIGLTKSDISTTKDNYPDWGIMGLGFCPGKACIASTYRLRGNNKLEKLYKVAVHELGHTQGLPHCPNQTCLMRDAEGKDHLDEEKAFCENCKNVLVKAGWKFE